MSDTLPENVTLGEVYRLVSKIDRTLNGNGQPGLVKMVEKHDTWLRLLGGSVALVAGVVVKTIVDLAGK